MGFFLYEEIFNGLVDDSSQVNLILLDEGKDSFGRLLYHQVQEPPGAWGLADGNLNDTVTMNIEDELQGGVHRQTVIDLAGRPLKLLAFPTDDLLRANETSQPWIVLIIGLGSSLLVAGYLLSGNRNTRRLEQMTEKLTLSEMGARKTAGDNRTLATALEHYNEELRSSNEELQQFAYVASHDLQEPLRMVASYNQLLARRYADKLDQEANDFINYSVDGAKRMQVLLNDLLEFSRVGSKGKDLEPTECGPVLAAVLTDLQIAITDANAEVTHDELPWVMADAVQLRQLFQNLINNAMKFRGDQAPRIHLSATLGNGEWTFSVRDNGIGIDPKYFDRIFVLFKRLHTREEYPGTGIGLAICRKIVQKHGGKMWVESAPGEGATFFFTLRKSEVAKR
ncbi:MAG: hypothetical protein IIC82_08460 [Chloroflexi bacterium]|nr:hypothetical protein [Chloroflexota bacterium]